MTMVIAAYFVRCLLQGPGHTNTWRRSLCCTSWLEVSPEILCCIVHAITYGLLTGLREHCGTCYASLPRSSRLEPMSDE